MNFKRTIILSALLVGGSTLFAQTSNLKKAAASIQKYEGLKGAGNAQLSAPILKTAQEAIDLAIEHEKTKNLAETWTYYALVYSNSAVDNKSAEDFAKAEKGITEARKFDTDKKHEANIKVAEQTLYAYNFNAGVAAWDKQDFAEAYKAFDAALVYMPGDTTLTYYAGIAAMQNKEYDKGLEKYLQLIDKKDFSQHKTILVDLPKYYMMKQDTAKALEFADLAASQYPNDKDAATQNIELNLIVGNESKIIGSIQKQIEQDANNKNLYYYLGLAYSANNQSTEALEAYNKAIAIDPDYTDAQLNAGVVLMNSIREEISTLNEDKKISNTDYAKKVAEIKERVKPVEANFLKVLTAEPNNVNALRGLKGLYDFLQLEEKAKSIEEKLNAL